MHGESGNERVNSVSIVITLRAEVKSGIGARFLAVAEIFFFATKSRPAPGLTQSAMEQVQQSRSGG